MGKAQAQGLLVQMGYMFRYQNGFCQIAEWVHSGLLGDIYCTRAHMSTTIDDDTRVELAAHQGGIFYDLAGHMLDQVVWLMGRPTRTTGFFRHRRRDPAGCADNTLGVLEFERGLAFVISRAWSQDLWPAALRSTAHAAARFCWSRSSRRSPSACAWSSPAPVSRPVRRRFP